MTAPDDPIKAAITPAAAAVAETSRNLLGYHLSELACEFLAEAAIRAAAQGLIAHGEQRGRELAARDIEAVLGVLPQDWQWAGIDQAANIARTGKP